MTHFDVSFFSNALCQNQRMKILASDMHTKDMKTDAAILYLFHGFSDSCESFVQNSSIARYFNDIPIYIVMPQADKSFYADMQHGSSYWQHINQEVPQFIATFFNATPRADKTFIAGVSMGGYGALKWILQAPHSVKKTFLFSPLIDIVSAANNGFDNAIDDNGFSAKQLGLANVFNLATLANSSDDLLYSTKTFNGGLPPIQIFCGKQDFLYHEILAYYSLLQNKNGDVEIFINDGSHNWQAWENGFFQMANDIRNILL